MWNNSVRQTQAADDIFQLQRGCCPIFPCVTEPLTMSSQVEGKSWVCSNTECFSVETVQVIYCKYHNHHTEYSNIILYGLFFPTLTNTLKPAINVATRWSQVDISLHMNGVKLAASVHQVPRSTTLTKFSCCSVCRDNTSFVLQIPSQCCFLLPHSWLPCSSAPVWLTCDVWVHELYRRSSAKRKGRCL